MRGDCRAKGKDNVGETKQEVGIGPIYIETGEKVGHDGGAIRRKLGSESSAEIPKQTKGHTDKDVSPILTYGLAQRREK